MGYDFLINSTSFSSFFSEIFCPLSVLNRIGRLAATDSLHLLEPCLLQNTVQCAGRQDGALTSDEAFFFSSTTLYPFHSLAVSMAKSSKFRGEWPRSFV